MMTRTNAYKRIAAVKENPIKPSDANNPKEILEYIVVQLCPMYGNGVVPLAIKEKELSLLLSITTSTLQKARCRYLPGSKESPFPPYCKTPGGGVFYRITDIVNWYMELPGQQSVGGGK